MAIASLGAHRISTMSNAFRNIPLLLYRLFSPSNNAGVHRVRHLVKHLPACRWLPIVVFVHEALYGREFDNSLLALTSETAEVGKVCALPDWACRPFGIGNISVQAQLN